MNCSSLPKPAGSALRSAQSGRIAGPWWRELTEPSSVRICAVVPARPRPKAAGSARLRVASRRSRRDALLVLHLDADKLKRDGLHLGAFARMSGAIGAACLASVASIQDVTTVNSLLRLLVQQAAHRRTYRTVAIVGHSNAHGIQVADACFVPWETLARVLAPLQARTMLLVACGGGRWDAADALFSKNRSLRTIYACPVKASKEFGALLLTALPILMAEPEPSKDGVLLGQLTTVALTGCQLRVWQRASDFRNPERRSLDAFAEALDPYARQIPTLLGTRRV